MGEMGVMKNMSSMSANNEWSSLQSAIVGRATNSCFPNEPARTIAAVMPRKYRSSFRPHHPFPRDIIEEADKELDQLVSILQREGVQVYRPEVVDWLEVGGYASSMPRDGLMTVGHHVIESRFAWRCRRDGSGFDRCKDPEGAGLRQ